MDGVGSRVIVCVGNVCSSVSIRRCLLVARKPSLASRLIICLFRTRLLSGCKRHKLFRHNQTALELDGRNPSRRHGPLLRRTVKVSRLRLRLYLLGELGIGLKLLVEIGTDDEGVPLLLDHHLQSTSINIRRHTPRCWKRH